MLHRKVISNPVEHRFYQKASLLGLAPKVVQLEKAVNNNERDKNPKWIMTTEKWNMTLHDFISELQDDRLLEQVQDRVLQLLLNLHQQANILHGDVHFDNVVVNFDNGEPKFALIDFELSSSLRGRFRRSKREVEEIVNLREQFKARRAWETYRRRSKAS